MGTNTGIGIGIGIPFRNNALGGDNIYFPPELKARMIGVWDNYGKKNTDADRNIIKNKIPNAGGDLEILNAAYEGMSGCNGYPVVFGANETWEKLSSAYGYTSDVTSTTIHITRVKNAGTGLLFSYVKKDGALTNIREIPAFRITVKGLEGNSKFGYRYLATEDATVETLVYLGNGTHELSKSFAPTEALLDLTRNVWVGIFITPMVEGEVVFDCDITIEVLPEYEGAFVTDGVNDIIISQKTIAEMGITDEVTIVSMIHQITLNSTYNLATTNYIENITTTQHVRTDVYAAGKTGIYGYTASLINSTRSTIGYILGDIRDYHAVGTTNKQTILDSKFSVVGRVSTFVELSSVAHYWTFAVLGIATADEINLIIAKYNLDRTLRPDILCNITKQGITNDNHADFNDKLIDYSGNGRDIQMYNLAWKGDSGIGKYEMDFLDWVINSPFINERTSFTFSSSNDTNDDIITIYQRVPAATQSFKIKAKLKGRVLYRYYVNNGDIISISYYEVKEGINILPDSADPTSVNGKVGFVLKELSSVKVEQIPSHAGALCLDGVNDFGKVTGMPVYKDYTVVADYERLKINIGVDSDSPILSKSELQSVGAFIFNTISSSGDKVSYSFGRRNIINADDTIRKIFYQSKYINDGQDINIESIFVDSDKLWLGTYRDSDYRFFNGAIYSLMSFPYSMSKFLIERQLKKHKLGTLYPDMVEFRPVIKSNASYDNIVFYYKNEKVENGTYLTVGSSIGMHICLSSNSVNEIKSITINGIPATFKFHDANNNIYQYDFNLTSKSPQKINITIDEYIRYEDIVQPYPSLFTLIDYDTEEVYSWGSKLKVGARFKGNVVNLLPNMYEWQGNVLYNGEVLDWGINPGVVAKEMVFSWNMPFKYLIDNNEPKCILSPRLLRIPNSSYKILGYIPDISGHGNNGVIHNSAYAEGSGVNEDGSYQLDGVDDFVTIPTIAGKQVLIKLNWQNKAIGNLIYDQRDNSSTTSFAIMPISINDTTNNKIAYQTKNANGITYIDGIRNEYIESYSLENIIHNITITNPDVSNKTVALGASNRTTADYFAKYALYDFMLFDNISTDDKILELNEYVGIEAKVELPPYYWDAYGKTNLDADKATIQQRGVAVGDYDLTNTNFAYDKMSGFGGYEFEKFTDTTKWIETKREDGIEVIEKNDYSFTAKKVGTGQYFWDFKNNSIKTLDRDLTVKAISNNNVYIRWEFKYRTAEKPDIDSAIILLRQAMTPNVPITVTLPYKTQEEQTELGVVEGSTYYLFYFDPIDIPVGDEYTVEMLPLYPNGLVYDGVSDFTNNKNIPILTDFTFIIKREILGLETNDPILVIKGDKVYNNGIKNAFILEHNNNGVNYVYSYGKLNQIKRDDSKIIYLTPESYNGNPIIKGENGDNLGLILSRHWKGIIYKTILYSKTISLLEINFLKNLMEKDEIIDLDNPIFKK
jgi:hypothetical protein